MGRDIKIKESLKLEVTFETPESAGIVLWFSVSEKDTRLSVRS